MSINATMTMANVNGNSPSIKAYFVALVMIILGIASHYASRIRGEADVKDAKQNVKRVLGFPEE